MNFGDKYIGGYVDNCYQGPGLCYSDNLDRWLFGYFEQNDVKETIVNRVGKLRKEHYYLEGFMEHLVYAAFGNIPRIKRQVFRQILKEVEVDFKKLGHFSNGDSTASLLRRNNLGVELRNAGVDENDLELDESEQSDK